MNEKKMLNVENIIVIYSRYIKNLVRKYIPWPRKFIPTHTHTHKKKESYPREMEYSKMKTVG